LGVKNVAILCVLNMGSRHKQKTPPWNMILLWYFSCRC